QGAGDGWVGKTLGFGYDIIPGVAAPALVSRFGRAAAAAAELDAVNDLAPFQEGAMSRLVPGGGLTAHEAAGGHTIAMHVGKTDAELAARLAAQPGIRGASSFTDRVVAESAIGQSLDANQAAINGWLQGGGNQLVIRHTLAETVGRSLLRGAANATD